jgi:Fas apoptotic inhibitory molecule (FAIM1)
MPRLESKVVQCNVPDVNDPWANKGLDLEAMDRKAQKRACGQLSSRRRSIKLDKKDVQVTESFERDGQTNVVSWDIPIDGFTNHIELHHGTVWGKRKIKVNGEKVVRKFKFFDTGSSHKVRLGSHELTINIRPNGIGFDYELHIKKSKKKSSVY